MEWTFRDQLFFLLLCLSVLKGDARYIEESEITTDGLLSLLNSHLRRDIPEELIYRRSLRCLDMVAVEGQFTFTADRSHLNCAVFFIADPNELLSLELDNVDIHCSAGDYIKVFDGWVMKGEKFPSNQDHPLSPSDRYVDYCERGVSKSVIRSSQNVAMVFFRTQTPASSFTITVRKLHNPYPCNVISQTAEGSFTMVIPQHHRNCSFSIIYPAEIQIQELSLEPLNQDVSLEHLNDFSIKLSGDATGTRNKATPHLRTTPGCLETGDFVELLGGNGMDIEKMIPIADLCYSNSPARMKIACDNAVVRLVSSGKFVNRVAFHYRSLDGQEVQGIRGNGLDDHCFSSH